ncbi:glycosyltransferase family 4 protein [Pseudogemmobacter sp. W21_MBD1_M6]|uniref:glycosyltransferase family 4 protein n=1 Tax=Pseudogemmobacter sp. W21_MBD1_M6 TaxID=3240271 RepID=UPI003F9A2C60
MNSSSKPSIMFLSDMCLLDRNSGAAIEMHDWLKMLVTSGYRVSSVSMSLFDGQEEYPFRMEIAPSIDPKEHVGKRIRVVRDGIENNIFNVGTSLARNLSTELITGFVGSAAEDIRRIQPDIVIGFGSRNLVPLRQLAKQLGARTIFYLANDSYSEDKRSCFDEIDEIVTPSVALRDLYNQRLGLSSTVIGNFLPDFAAIAKPTIMEVEQRRRSKIVTIVNPSLVKGGLFFMQVAAVMENVDPSITFMAIESRVLREHMETFVNNSSRLSNIWWLQRQSDMHRVYRHSAVLLMPSLWFEAAGRIVPEAQTHGVPVLAHRVGALPEQLGSGGELIDVPERLAGKFEELPTPIEVLPWVRSITRLLSNASRYQDLSRRALVSARRHDPSERAEQIRQFMESQVDRKLATKPSKEVVE